MSQEGTASAQVFQRDQTTALPFEPALPNTPDIMPTRAEIRSLLNFYNALPLNSTTQCRIGEAAGRLKATYDWVTGPEDRAFARFNYEGESLTMRTFPMARAMATKMYRDNPDTFVQAEFLARNAQYVVDELQRDV